MARIRYNFSVVDSRFSILQIDTSARPGNPDFGSAPGARESPAWKKHESSPRLAARDGMEQEPYEFRIRPAKPESKGKATHGKFRKHAFLASQKLSFERGPALRIVGSLSTPQVHARSCCARRKHGRHRRKRGRHAAGRPQVRREIDQSPRRPGGRAPAPR